MYIITYFSKVGTLFTIEKEEKSKPPTTSVLEGKTRTALLLAARIFAISLLAKAENAEKQKLTLISISKGY